MSEAAQRIADYSVRDGIAVITLNNPPVNSLGNALRAAIMEYLKKAEGDPAVKGAVLIGSAKAFSGGADIREFNKPREKPDLAELNDQQDAMTKPLVAAIGGFALGGGLELALACHFRIALPKSQLGLPEVKLGLLPGSGGTQRLPRIIAMAEALRMMTSGNPIAAERAKLLGLVDEIVEGDLLEAAVLFLARLLKEGRPRRRIRDMQAKVDGDPKAFFAQAREQVAREWKGYPAPLEIVACAQAAATRPFDEGRKFERERFAHLVNTTESKALRHMFFAERQTTRIPGVPEDTPVREIGKAAVIGAGTMGGGIAMNFANVGIPVTVVEVQQEALDRGLGIVRKNYETTASRGRLTMADVEKRMGLIRGTTDFNAIADADIVIEAVFEEMPIKKEVFAKIDKIAKPDAVLATNTSTLDVNEIASATSRPESVIGTHFFSPANVMRLLENVRGAKSSKTAIATAMAVGRRINKVPVLVGVCYGFVGNRMLHQRGIQAEKLILEGALPHQVDRVLYDFGFPMGPFAMGDLAGLDVGWRIRKGRGVKSPVADRICELGRFGQKTGAGYYKYDEKRNPTPDPDVEKIIVDVSTEMGITRRPISDEEILQRLLYPMVNEGAKILEEKMALRASDIDVIWVYGYGWPVYRGGPMFWADSIGLEALRDTMLGFQRKTGDAFWTPALLLNRLADAGKGFLDR